MKRWLVVVALTLAPGMLVPALSFAQDGGSAPASDAARATTAPSAAEPSKEPPIRSAASLVSKARPSIVTIRVAGRDGTLQSMGAGFVVSADGLIATNYHVLGEARPFTVELAHGRKLEVEEVYASDRHLDLAVIRVQLKNEQLPVLELGDADNLPQGEAIATIGNPLGLQLSVVTGVVSAFREIENRRMIQLAMPIQPGNSGGPVLDQDGRVLGIVTMMSRDQPNVGFAVPVNDIKPLLAKPNPIPMHRWLTIGALDAARWTPLFGAEWRQRSGRIVVEGVGRGFGGRSLCLRKAEKPPELPFELSVSVKMADESGAAGLVFHSDGEDRHYGFYPSNGRLRLSRFDGPDVERWNVLREVDSRYYRAGDWNDLRVRVDDERIRCFVNGHLVIESQDTGLRSGQIGLAKFRNTRAEFKGFHISPPSDAGGDAVNSELSRELERLPPLKQFRSEQVPEEVLSAEDTIRAIGAEAKRLEQRASELRQMASDLRLERIIRSLAKIVEESPQAFDLLHAALLVASVDEADVVPAEYIEQVDRMAEEIKISLPEKASGADRIGALNRYLFAENGFHGSRFDYDNRANSYLSRVIDEREGLPITLSILYMELAERLDLKVVGVGLPGHFVVRWEKGPDEGQLIDVFDGGKSLTRDEATKLVSDTSGQTLREDHLRAATNLEILVRMIRNLIGNSQRSDDKEAMLRYHHLLVSLLPDSVTDRGLRAVLRSETGRRDGAIADLDWILERQPPGIDLERIREMRRYFEERDP